MEARPGCERGATFERSENGVASTLPPAGATTGRAVSPEAKWSRTATSAGVRARGHIRAKRKWGSEHVAPGGGNDRPRGFAGGEMEPNGDKRRVFAVGDPARQSRDGDGKILVRGDEVMAAKRTTAQGGFAQRNAAPAFARQTQKAGPMTGRAVSPQVKCDRTGARAGAGTEAACGKRRRPPAVAGLITSLRRPTFLALRK